MRKEYLKPQVEINAFISEDIVTTSSTSDEPTTTPDVLRTMAGRNIGSVGNLFN